MCWVRRETVQYLTEVVDVEETLQYGVHVARSAQVSKPDVCV